ncbi:MAG: tetratricopeptide repeat protein [Saprospiraceae bacterium]
MRTCYLFLSAFCLLIVIALNAQNKQINSTLKGRILYQSSGNKPAIGVYIKDVDSNTDYSSNPDGDYSLTFQSKRNGAALALKVGSDNWLKQKIELVNEKEVKAARVPDHSDAVLDIIVCPAGQRDIAAQKYYRILRTTADRELEKKKKEVDGLLVQQEKDYQKISDLFGQIDQVQAALDSAKIREQAFSIASINLDRASQLVKDALKKIEEENDVEGALRILNAEALDTAYQHASALKKKAEVAIRQVIEGYEFKISLLEPQFQYGEIAACYEKIAGIYENEGYDQEKLALYWAEIGKYKGTNGEYQKALEFNLKALNLRKQVLHEDHPELATSYNNVGVDYGNLGEYQKALECHFKAISLREKNFSDSLALTQSYTNIAFVYSKLRAYQKAFEYYQKVLSIHRKILYDNHPELAKSYHDMAFAYNNLNDYSKGLEFNLKALTIRENILTTDDPVLALSYHNLAATYADLGNYQKALEFNLKTLAIREKVLHPAHPKLAESYSNLSFVYGYIGNHQKALEYNLKALAIWEKVLPTDHPDLALSYHNLTIAYGNFGNYQKALEFNTKALMIYEKVLPVGHIDLAQSYRSMAYIYSNLEDYQKAFEFYAKALNITEKNLPSDHPDLAISYNDIGRACRDTGNFEKGIEYSKKAVRIGESSNPKPDYLNLIYANLGITYLRAHQYTEAKTVLEKSENLKPGERVYRGWAMYYALQKNIPRALENLEKAIDLGCKDLKWIETDDSLESIRGQQGYKEIVQRLKKR